MFLYLLTASRLSVSNFRLENTIRRFEELEPLKMLAGTAEFVADINQLSTGIGVTSIAPQ